MSPNFRRAVFLDRDGTIIEDKGFICSFREVALYPNAVEALRIFKGQGYRLILTSNQSAVARGICSMEQVRELHRQLNDLLIKEGAGLDAIYFSPYLEGGNIKEYSRASECRKPSPGMILRACREHSLDPGSSIAIGDSRRDIEAGRRAGAETALVLTGKGQAERELIGNPGEMPDHIFSDILEAARYFREKKVQ